MKACEHCFQHPRWKVRASIWDQEGWCFKEIKILLCNKGCKTYQERGEKGRMAKFQIWSMWFKKVHASPWLQEERGCEIQYKAHCESFQRSIGVRRTRFSHWWSWSFFPWPLCSLRMLTQALGTWPAHPLALLPWPGDPCCFEVLTGDQQAALCMVTSHVPTSGERLGVLVWVWAKL